MPMFNPVCAICAGRIMYPANVPDNVPVKLNGLPVFIALLFPPRIKSYFLQKKETFVSDTEISCNHDHCKVALHILCSQAHCYFLWHDESKYVPKSRFHPRLFIGFTAIFIWNTVVLCVEVTIGWPVFSAVDWYFSCLMCLCLPKSKFLFTLVKTTGVKIWIVVLVWWWLKAIVNSSFLVAHLGLLWHLTMESFLWKVCWFDLKQVVCHFSCLVMSFGFLSVLLFEMLMADHKMSWPASVPAPQVQETFEELNNFELHNNPSPICGKVSVLFCIINFYFLMNSLWYYCKNKCWEFLCFLGWERAAFWPCTKAVGKSDCFLQNSLLVETIWMLQWCHLGYVAKNKSDWHRIWRNFWHNRQELGERKMDDYLENWLQTGVKRKQLL